MTPHTSVLGVLRDPRFLRFYLAQAVSQLGDAVLWMALALVAVRLEGAANAPVVVAIALTLRVGAYVALGPVAGVLADKVERRTLLAACHLGRAFAVAAMFWVTAPWQVYALMFATNAFTAFFTPVNQATVPLVAGARHTRAAFALSAATTEIFGIIGPGLGGLLAVALGGRSLFLIIGALFLAAAALAASLGELRAPSHDVDPLATLAGVRDGTARLWRDAPVRFALLAELVAAISGALILTVTVARVQGGLGLTEAHFGWVMAAYGIGATAASLAVAKLATVTLPRWIAVGAVFTSVAVLPADFTPFGGLVLLWVLAGVGQNWVNLPTEALIAERTPLGAQGRVYGAHFAWSHVWWAFTYPLAAVLTLLFPGRTFLAGGIVSVVVLVVVLVAHRGMRATVATAPAPAEAPTAAPAPGP